MKRQSEQKRRKLATNRHQMSAKGEHKIIYFMLLLSLLSLSILSSLLAAAAADGMEHIRSLLADDSSYLLDFCAVQREP